ncbi:MAG: isovaleryl-CoA dehydrogenase [Deltaproteobacteria bacterium]|nr:isovaleryl-CoA dehydrogenase [Deltaproteobacteria bacterium]
MQLVLTEEQELLAKTAGDWVREHSPVTRVRQLRDTNDPTGFSRPLWKQMAELGWVGIVFPEQYGGAGMGYADLAVVLEALGRTLAPEPFLSTVLLGGQALLVGGSDAQKKAWLPGLCEGGKLLALAQQEPKSRHDLFRVATRARPDGTGFRLEGEKIQVLDAQVADALLVVARSSGGERDAAGLTLFLVPRDAAGLRVTPQTRIDHRNAALVRLDGVRVGADAVVGAIGQGGALLQQVVDCATVGLCAEMLGATSQVFDDTLHYLKTRIQFGVPIGSFQALKHRAARVFMEIELARSAVMAVARAADAGDADFEKLVSLAKARCSDAFVLAANEAVQMFGGVGMTDEYDVGFYLKRARVAEMTFGDAAWHRERYARLGGY